MGPMNRPTAPQVLWHRATQYVVAIRGAANAIRAEDSASGLIFDACRHAAETALSRAGIEPEVLAKLKALGDPADLLAAVFLQKKCADLPGFRDRTRAESLRFVGASDRARSQANGLDCRNRRSGPARDVSIRHVVTIPSGLP